MKSLTLYNDGLQEHHRLLQDVLSDETVKTKWEEWVTRAVKGYRSPAFKIYFCGNGGSAADAQHLAAELSGRFELNRPPLFAEALHVNSSFLTAVANDFGYDNIYERGVQAFMQEKDMLIAMSTSGQSPNILQAAKAAKEQGVQVIGMTGASGGTLKDLCDVCLRIPHKRTARIQEMHMLLGHLFCQAVERELFPHA